MEGRMDEWMEGQTAGRTDIQMKRQRYNEVGRRIIRAEQVWMLWGFKANGRNMEMAQMREEKW